LTTPETSKKMESVDKMLARLQKEANTGAIKHVDQSTGEVEAAQFDIIVARDSVNINEFLPFPVFGISSLQAGLQQDIAGFLPAGVSLVAIKFGINFSAAAGATLTNLLGDSQKLILQFLAGAALDTITVTCSSTAYPQFVASTYSDVFRLTKIRYAISNVAITAQYSQQLTFQRKTIFGKLVQNTLTPSAFRKPDDFQTGIVDIDINADVDKETTIWSKISNTAGFSITLSVFVSRVSKFSAPVQL